MDLIINSLKSTFTDLCAFVMLVIVCQEMVKTQFP